MIRIRQEEAVNKFVKINLLRGEHYFHFIIGIKLNKQKKIM